MILHIFPTEMSFDTVMVQTQFEDAYTMPRFEPRDKIFAMLSHPAFRCMYDDVYYHG